MPLAVIGHNLPRGDNPPGILTPAVLFCWCKLEPSDRQDLGHVSEILPYRLLGWCTHVHVNMTGKAHCGLG